ncbi:MAG: helix-turn-helix domain-containing protein [Pseudomonadota bacterium]|jgi:predicted site-specific integrase-resolvase
MERLLSFGDLCRITGVKPGCMRKWLRSGDGPVSRWTPGGKRRFFEKDIREWVESLSTENPNQRQREVA